MEAKTPTQILSDLLTIDLRFNASKLGFVAKSEYSINRDFIGETVNVLNILSVKRDDFSKRQLMGICSLIWTYARIEWPGLKDYLILFLSRSGFGPSSIMIDDEYDRVNKTFSASSSLMNQMAVTVRQTEFEIAVGKETFLLTEFQKDVWDNIEKNKLTGISAPTSAGKSHIILLKAIDLIMKQSGTILYVVPTLSLVSQVAQDFRKALNQFEIRDYKIETSINPESDSLKTIFVLTQEKAITTFSQTELKISKIRYLVIDEIQNIERVADSNDQRAKVLFDLMVEFKNRIEIDHIILAGPRIDNIGELGLQIFDVSGYSSETKSSPVMSLTYSISKDKKGFSFNLHSDLVPNTIKIKIDDSISVDGYGKREYTKEYLEFLKLFIDKIGSKESNIIFSPTTDISRKIAEAIIQTEGEVQMDESLEDLSKYLARTVSPYFSLCTTIQRGVAYHHGKLPHHVRIVVEDCIRNQKIRNVVCTTTLLQGVNLPIQNIIIRNPDLLVRARSGGIPKLTPYEIANLRGRAGRLLKDLIGRTFILNEDGFKDETQVDQPSLFKEETKTLKAGYKEKFAQFNKEIKAELLGNSGQSQVNQEYSYLTTYIRQNILRYGLNSPLFLSRVGIDLSDKEIQDTYNILLKLDLPKELYSTNRYWDPFDLALLVRKSQSISVPINLGQDRIAYQLRNIIEFFRDNLPLYFNKYVNLTDKGNYLLSRCITTERWMKEDPLNKLLDFHKTSNKIEDVIKFVQNTVSFGMPMLFKPLYDIKGDGHFIPRCMELGAFNPNTRKLIELDVPRETAITINRMLNNRTSIEDEELIQRVIKLKPSLSYWEQIQLNSIC